MPQEVAASLTLAAPAKINLYLEVLGRRADGYHELVTCMVPIDWADELTFTLAQEIQLTCDDSSLPLDEKNLVLRAAKLLRQTYLPSPLGGEGLGVRGQPRHPIGAHVHLKKRIPVAAGLGGGSSDAASTLLGLNQLWQFALSHDQLTHLAAQLGSDVPFFLSRSAAWCLGRGEHVTPIHQGGSIPLLLIAPIAGLSTAEVYRELQAPALSPITTRSQVEYDSSIRAPAARRLLGALEQGDGQRIGAALFNRLQQPAERLLPLVAEVRQLLDELAPEQLFWGHQMSGSGSSYFVVCRGQAEAQRLARLVSIRWAGGVLNTGMGTAETKDGPPERTIRLLVTQTK